jgi:hypothetical protein
MLIEHLEKLHFKLWARLDELDGFLNGIHDGSRERSSLWHDSHETDGVIGTQVVRRKTNENLGRVRRSLIGGYLGIPSRHKRIGAAYARLPFIMRLPRWLVVSLLTTSVFTVVGAGAWWWLTWPERAAREFQSLLAQRKWDDASAMLLYAGVDYPPDTVMAWLAGSNQDELTLEPQPWTLTDVCRGRRQFKLGQKRVVYFIAARGRITEWNTWSSARY